MSHSVTIHDPAGQIIVDALNNHRMQVMLTIVPSPGSMGNKPSSTIIMNSAAAHSLAKYLLEAIGFKLLPDGLESIEIPPLPPALERPDPQD